jgi:hypothetical protein
MRDLGAMVRAQASADSGIVDAQEFMGVRIPPARDEGSGGHHVGDHDDVEWLSVSFSHHPAGFSRSLGPPSKLDRRGESLF